MRIVITGHPNAGKTTLAKMFNCEHTRSTDDLIASHEWSELSDTVSYWFDCWDPYVIEGVAIPRALRKWRKRNPDSPPPFDLFIWLKHEPLTPMAKGIETVMDSLWKWIGDSKVLVLGGIL